MPIDFPPYQLYDPRLKQIGLPYTMANYPAPVPNISNIPGPDQNYSPVSPQMINSAQEPNFGPYPITPKSLTPTAQENIPVPRREDYPNSKLMTVLNAIAGGFAGAAGGPKVGMEVGQALHDIPYTHAMERYKSLTEDQKRRLGIEQEAEKAAQKEAELGIQRGTGQGMNLYHQVIGAAAKQKANTGDVNANTRLMNEIISAEHKKALENIDLVKAGKKTIDQWGAEILQMPEDTEEQKATKKAAFDEWTKAKQAGWKPLDRIQDEAKARTTGTSLVQASPLGAAAASNTQGSRTTATVQAQEQTPVSGIAADAVNKAVQMATANPDTLWQVYGSLPDRRSKEAFLAQYQGPTPRKLNTEEQKIRITASTAVGHADKLLSLAKDPDIINSSGPLKGRLAQLYQAIGSDFSKPGPHPEAASRIENTDITAGLDPEGKQAMFLDLMKYLVLFEASATSGTRPSWQLIRELKETQGAKFDTSRMLGNLKAAQQSAYTRIEQLYKPTAYGKPVEQPKEKPKPSGITVRFHE
jgi:hypothetical protein